MPFQFENLDVYKKSLDWVEAVETLCESLKGKASYSLIYNSVKPILLFNLFQFFKK